MQKVQTYAESADISGMEFRQNGSHYLQHTESTLQMSCHSGSTSFPTPRLSVVTTWDLKEL